MSLLSKSAPAAKKVFWKVSELSTDCFRPGMSAAINTVIMNSLVRNWWIAALPVSVLLVIGLYIDIRWLFVAAMLLFIVYPAMIAMAWMSLLGRGWATRLLYSQRVTLYDDNTIEVKYLSTEGLDNAELPGSVTIAADDIGGCRVRGNNIVLIYGDNEQLIIPFKAFYSNADISTFLVRFASGDELARLES